MPEDTANTAQNTSDGDGKNTGAAQAAETHAAQNKFEDTQKAEGEKTFSQAELEATVKRIRAEEKRKFEQQLKDAQLSETERATKRVGELEAELRRRNARDAVVTAALKAGSSNGEAIYLLGERILEFDSKTDQPTNLKDVLDYAREKAPELFPRRPGSGNGGEGQNAQPNANMNDMIRRLAGR